MFQSYGTTSIPAFDNLYEVKPGVTHPTTWHDRTNQVRKGAVARFFADLERKRVSDTGCALCTVLEGLRHTDTYQHPTLGVGFYKIHDLPTAIAALTHDQYYTGYSLVIAKTHATELYHLPESESIDYYKDMLRVAKAIGTAFQPQKINYELLGNTVAHLHWHLVPRYGWDPQPQRPIWEHTHEPKILSPEAYAESIAAIRQALA
jgi:diadenosine tetraphosphate (Ap4A) HIT family hydrolase